MVQITCFFSVKKTHGFQKSNQHTDFNIINAIKLNVLIIEVTYNMLYV